MSCFNGQIIITFYLLRGFHTSGRWLFNLGKYFPQALVVSLSLESEKHSRQASWIVLSIMADISQVIVLMVMIFPSITNWSILFPSPLWTVPREPTSIYIKVTHMFHRLFFFGSVFLFSFFYFQFVVRWNSIIHSLVRSLFFC